MKHAIDDNQRVLDLGHSLLPDGPKPSYHARMRLLGTEAHVFYRLDEVQDAYRRAVGARSLERLGDIECLLGLPSDTEVTVDSLTERERFLLHKVPRWAVSSRNGRVTRLATPPLRVDLVITRAVTWQRGVDLASRFASFCRRLAWVERMPRNSALARLEADYYGVGLAVTGPDGPESVVAPEPHSLRYRSAVQWEFVEQIYRGLAGSSTVGPITRGEPPNVSAPSEM